MIKFGNDIVTVGGDWLKMPPEPQPIRFVNYPTASLSIPATDVLILWDTIGYRNRNYRYTTIRLNYSNVNGELRWYDESSVNNGQSFLTVDIASPNARQISPKYRDKAAYFYDAHTNNGTVDSDNIITLSSVAFINRIVYDWDELKIYFYDINNNLIAYATVNDEFPFIGAGMYWNPSSSNPCTLTGGAEGWYCHTLEQALSV